MWDEVSYACVHIKNVFLDNKVCVHVGGVAPCISSKYLWSYNYHVSFYLYAFLIHGGAAGQKTGVPKPK